jgi:hypothetical protein
MFKPAAGTFSSYERSQNHRRTLTNIGACGVPGYAFMGIYKEFQKIGKTSEGDYLVAARLAQGEAEYGSLSGKDVRTVVESWQSLRASINGKGE